VNLNICHLLLLMVCDHFVNRQEKELRCLV